MGAFANKKVDQLESVLRYMSEKRAQNVFQDASCVLGGEKIGGKGGQDAQPKQRGQPREELSRRRSWSRLR